MGKTELFILLPEYIDAKISDYTKNADIVEDSELSAYFQEIYSVVDFFEHEIYDGYYDSENIKAFLYPIEILKDYYPCKERLLRLFLKKWGEDWRACKVQNVQDTYKYYGVHVITDDTLCEMTKRKHEDSDKAYLLISHNALHCDDELLRTSCNTVDIELQSLSPDIKNITSWFESSRIPQRTFNLNPKHGESGVGAYPSNKGEKVSVLLCSKGAANSLLKKAVGINTYDRTMYYYDVKHKRYIEFKHEANFNYHGFHLDDEDAKRVPKTVIKKLKVLEPTLI